MLLEIPYLTVLNATREFILNSITITAEKIKFSIKDFFSKYDPTHSFLQICSRLLKNSLMEASFFVQCITGEESWQKFTNWAFWYGLNY